jgi:4-hydroxy-tetrahydrodipicolinate synthase
MSVSIGHQSLGLAAFAVGATGWTTGIANTIPTLCVEVFEEAVFRKNYDTARRLFNRILPLCDFYADKSLCRSVKAAAELLNKPLGAPRLPLQRLSVADYKTLEKLLVECGTMRQKQAA